MLIRVGRKDLQVDRAGHRCCSPGAGGGGPEPRQHLWGWRGVGAFKDKEVRFAGLVTGWMMLGSQDFGGRGWRMNPLCGDKNDK